ncbi:hypothetical protein F5B20DRAFT_541795, partial [Whalleya microplaca]
METPITFESGLTCRLCMQVAWNAPKAPATEIGCSHIPTKQERTPESVNPDTIRGQERSSSIVDSSRCPLSFQIPRVLVEDARRMAGHNSTVGIPSALPAKSERIQNSDCTPSESSVDPSTTGEISASSASQCVSSAPSISSRQGEQRRIYDASASPYRDPLRLLNRKNHISGNAHPQNIVDLSKEPLQRHRQSQSLNFSIQEGDIVDSILEYPYVNKLDSNDQAPSILSPITLSMLPTGSREDPASHDVTLGPARANTPGPALVEPEPCQIFDLQEMGEVSDEDEEDEYWFWDREAQKFAHLNEDTGKKEYHPDEF